MKAIIDLGTNTFHLLIADIMNGEVKEYAKLQLPVKIGEGGINQGVIEEAAYTRGMNALQEFSDEIKKWEVKEILAFGTSALRDAENGGQFIEEALERYNISIAPITGDEEAAFIYEGVRRSFDFPDQPVLVMDIGGGSVEFIIGEKEKILWMQSYPIGAARLIENYHQQEPIQNEEVERLNRYLKDTLGELHQAVRQYAPEILIGSAGSFETLEEVVRKDFRKEVKRLCEHAHEIELNDFQQFYHTMLRMNRKERGQLNGMVDFRVEMIVVAAVLMHYILHHCGIKQLIASGYSLKEGMLFGLGKKG